MRHQGVLNVLGNIHQDRAGPAGVREMKGFLHDPGDVPGVLHEVVMLGDRPGDLDHRGFLEGVGADDVRRNLPRDRDQRNRVELRVGQSGDEIERTGPGGGHHHPRLAGHPRVALGREDPSLLVPRKDRPDPVAIPRESLMHRHAGSAWIGEDHLDAVPNQ